MSGLRNVREAKFFHKNSHYMDFKKKNKNKKTPKILVKIKAKLSFRDEIAAELMIF